MQWRRDRLIRLELASSMVGEDVAVLLLHRNLMAALVIVRQRV